MIIRRVIVPAALLCLLMAAAWGDEEQGLEVGGQATVKVLDQNVFSQPLFYSQPLLSLSLGETVTLTGQQGDWFEVLTPSGVSGWVHRTSITEEAVELASTGGGSGSVSAEEITLSGRGFNAEIEASYSDQNPSLDFDAVDEMERLEVAPGDLHDFLVEGGLVETPAVPETQEGGGSR